MNTTPLDTIPWYRSAILRQQIAQMVIAVLTLFGIASENFDVDATLAAVFAGAGGLIAIWTFGTRMFKPTPPITAVAVEAIQERDAKIATAKRQGGFVRPLLLALMFVFASTTLMVLPGCIATRSAYREAQSLDEYAYVLTEHYAALVKQAADLKDKPNTPASTIAAMRKADLVAGPAVAKLRPLALALSASRSSATQAELQKAVDEVVLALADLVRATKGK